MINRELGIFVYMLCAAFLMQKLRFHSFLVSRLLLFSPPVEAIPASSATISLHFVGASDLIPRSEIFIIGVLSIFLYFLSKYCNNVVLSDNSTPTSIKPES